MLKSFINIWKRLSSAWYFSFDASLHLNRFSQMQSHFANFTLSSMFPPPTALVGSSREIPFNNRNTMLRIRTLAFRTKEAERTMTRVHVDSFYTLAIV